MGIMRSLFSDCSLGLCRLSCPELCDIVRSPPPPPRHHHSGHHSAAAIVGAGILSGLVIAGAVYCYCRRRRHAAVVVETCSVCLGHYRGSDLMWKLPECSHSFHRDCIRVWLRANASCPLCRTPSLLPPVESVPALPRV